MTKETQNRISSPSSTDILVSQWTQERPDLDQQHFGILFRIRALAMLLDQQAAIISKQFGLKSPELYLLYALRRGGKPYRMRPTDIYKLLRVTSGTITYRLDSLEQAGLVTRIPDPNDRRSVVIQLTESGKELADRAVDATLEVLGTPLNTIFESNEQSEMFINVLRKLGVLYDRLIDDSDNPLIHDMGEGSDPDEAVPTRSRKARGPRAAKTK